MAHSLDFSKRSFCVVTGASRGIGQRIAIEIARKVHNESSFLLLARSESKLNETKQEMLSLNESLTVHVHPMDLTKPTVDEFETILGKCLNDIESTGFDNALIVHNAASVGNVARRADELSDLAAWQEYFSFNLFSVAVLNSVFIKKLSKFSAKKFIVNITSLVGRQPFKYMAEYGTGKAAREIFFKVLAKESGADLSVLNYSPGPVETDMVKGVMATSGDEELRKEFAKMIEQKTIVQPEQTVLKFLSILEGGKYQSGDTIDYFDA